MLECFLMTNSVYYSCFAILLPYQKNCKKKAPGFLTICDIIDPNSLVPCYKLQVKFFILRPFYSCSRLYKDIISWTEKLCLCSVICMNCTYNQTIHQNTFETF